MKGFTEEEWQAILWAKDGPRWDDGGPCDSVLADLVARGLMTTQEVTDQCPDDVWATDPDAVWDEYSLTTLGELAVRCELAVRSPRMDLCSLT